MILQYSKMNKLIKDPVRANPSDAGLDIFYYPMINQSESVTIEPGTSAVLGTGLKFGIPHGYMLEVKNRSSCASKLQLLVGACVIDSGYDGEVIVNLHNVGKTPRVVSRGDKIAQLVMIPVIHARPKLVNEEVLYSDDICISNRGSGGFGSTG